MGQRNFDLVVDKNKTSLSVLIHVINVALINGSWRAIIHM
jgi:hypothetical protein